MASAAAKFRFQWISAINDRFALKVAASPNSYFGALPWSGQDDNFRILCEYQNLGAAWAFGLIGTFEIWGEAGGNTSIRCRDGHRGELPGLVGSRPSATAEQDWSVTLG
jgi:hypothetical protein